MRLGFDIDGVVADMALGISNYIENNFGISWSPYYLIDYNIKDYIFHKDKKYNLEIVNSIVSAWENPEFLFKLIPYDNVTNTIFKFKRLGHKIFFITSRCDKLKPVTIEWLKKYNIVFDKLETIGPNTPKGKYGNLLNLDMYVDDLEINLISMLQYKNKWKKNLLLFDRPWNCGKQINSKFIRINSWKKLLRHVGISNR